MKPLRVCIDARLISGTAGGVEQFIVGLAYGFSQLTSSNEEYYFLMYPNESSWLTPYISGSCRVLYCSKAPSNLNFKNVFEKTSPILLKFLKKIYPFSGRWRVSGLWSDGTIENAKIDIMHFTHQIAFITKIPSIYHPHDLQHIFLPSYFTFGKRFIREIIYRTFCFRAKIVAVASTWVKSDLVNLYNLSENKVQVIPLAPVITAYDQLKNNDIYNTHRKYGLPQSFVFYPAQALPHKNHINLLEAAFYLKENYGIIIPLVFSGSTSSSFFTEIEKHIDKLGLVDQVYFLGYVSSLELKSLYRLAKFVIVPTKYEAGSFPIWEAFISGVPVACSNVTSLPMQVGDAALLFDPDSVEDIKNVMKKLWTDEILCEDLIKKGYENVARFSWDKTVKTFRAHYRKIYGLSLSDEDLVLLSSPPLI
jgi:glycosyltransferase involved in cell wall biosynthesis